MNNVEAIVAKKGSELLPQTFRGTTLNLSKQKREILSSGESLSLVFELTKNFSSCNVDNSNHQKRILAIPEVNIREVNKVPKTVRKPGSMLSDRFFLIFLFLDGGTRFRPLSFEP